ncbi:uncharacterized protein RHO17_023194 isoform 2-T2 [Thomomys bottae]
MELRSSLLGPTDARLAPLCRRSLQIVPWIGSEVCTIWRKLHLANRCGRWFDVRGPQSSLASWHRIVWRSPSLQITLQDRSWGLSSEPGHCV